MAERNMAVYGIYADRPKAEAAIANLKQAGFLPAHFAVLLPPQRGAVCRKAVKAATGAVSQKEWMLRVSARTGEVIFSAMLGLGIPRRDAQRYRQGVEAGGILLAVYPETPARGRRAKALLLQTGAGSIGVVGNLEAGIATDDSGKPAVWGDAGEEWDH